MEFFRKTFPNESVTPKLHLMECHVTPFLYRWRWGLGVYNEQGGKGIHAEFNNLRRVYAAMKPDEARLLAMMKEHHLRVNPTSRTLRPEIKKKEKMRNK